MSDSDRQLLFGAARRALEPVPEDKARNARVLAAKLGVAIAAAGATSASVGSAQAGAAATKAAVSTAAKAGLSAKALLALKILGAVGLTTGVATVAALQFSAPSPSSVAPAGPQSVAHVEARPASSSSFASSSPPAPSPVEPAPALAAPSGSPEPPPAAPTPAIEPGSALGAPPANVAHPPAPRASSGEARAPHVAQSGGAKAASDRSPPSTPQPSAAPSARPDGTASSQFTEEIALVRAMHAAIAERASARAIALADEHARRFPHGPLGLEVEGLRVVAQCQAAPSAAARRLASDFEVRHPRAPMVDRVRAACGTE